MWCIYLIFSVLCLISMSQARVIPDERRYVQHQPHLERYEDEYNDLGTRLHQLPRGFLRDYVHKTIREELNRYYDTNRMRNDDSHTHDAEINALVQILRTSDQEDQKGQEDQIIHHYISANMNRLKRIVRRDFHNTASQKRADYVRHNARNFRNFLRRDYDAYKRAILPKPLVHSQYRHRGSVGTRDVPQAAKDVEVKGVPIVTDVKAKEDVPKILLKAKKKDASNAVLLADASTKNVPQGKEAVHLAAKVPVADVPMKQADGIVQKSASDVQKRKSAADASATDVKINLSAGSLVSLLQSTRRDQIQEQLLSLIKNKISKDQLDVLQKKVKDNQPADPKKVEMPGAKAAADAEARRVRMRPNANVTADAKAKKVRSRPGAKPAADAEARRVRMRPGVKATADVKAKKPLKKPDAKVAADVKAKNVSKKTAADAKPKKPVTKPAADIHAKKTAQIPSKKAAADTTAGKVAQASLVKLTADVPAIKTKVNSASTQTIRDAPKLASVTNNKRTLIANPLVSIVQAKSNKDQFRRQLLNLVKDDLTSDQFALLEKKLEQKTPAADATIKEKPVVKPVADTKLQVPSMERQAVSDERRGSNDNQYVAMQGRRKYIFPSYDEQNEHRDYQVERRNYLRRGRPSGRYLVRDYQRPQRRPMLRRKLYDDRHYDRDLDDLSASVSGVRTKRSHRSYDNLFRDEPETGEPEVINLASTV